MLRILLRADDLGYSEGVNHGLAWACDNGLPMSIGLMMNLPAVRHGYELIAGRNHCLGMHATISAGRPLSAPQDVPSLVDQNGSFLPSDLYRKATEDRVALEDVEREAEAQYQAFVEMVGAEPEYVDVHAVSSKNFVAGVRRVAARHTKPFSFLSGDGDIMRVGTSDVLLHASQGELTRLLADVAASNERMAAPVTHILMLHPGYVDGQLIRSSSLTIGRTADADLLRSAELRAFATRPDIELVTYRDL